MHPIVKYDSFTFQFSAPLTAILIVAVNRTSFSDTVFLQLIANQTAESPILVLDRGNSQARPVLFPLSVIVIEVLDAELIVRRV